MKRHLVHLLSIALLLTLGVATTVGAVGSPLEFLQMHTFQNLTASSSKFHGHYLSIDADGSANLSASSSQNASGSYWEVKRLFWKERGYTAHALVQRGNNRYNGQYLAVDPATGKLFFSKTEIPTARWLVRYAGKYQGWDATYIQTLAETGTTDMHFLAIEELTGAVRLSSEATPGAHWLMTKAPDLPAESGY